MQGRDISDPEVQKDLIAQEACENSYTKEALENAAKQINDDIQFGGTAGIDGVPFFVFNNEFSLAGAHPAPVILSAIDAAVAGA